MAVVVVLRYAEFGQERLYTLGDLVADWPNLLHTTTGGTRR